MKTFRQLIENKFTSIPSHILKKRTIDAFDQAGFTHRSPDGETHDFLGNEDHPHLTTDPSAHLKKIGWEIHGREHSRDRENNLTTTEGWRHAAHPDHQMYVHRTTGPSSLTAHWHAWGNIISSPIKESSSEIPDVILHKRTDQVLANHSFEHEAHGKYNGGRGTTKWSELHADLTKIGWEKYHDKDDGLGRTIRYSHPARQYPLTFNTMNKGGAPDIAFYIKNDNWGTK